jgi:hypothetical protein
MNAGFLAALLPNNGAGKRMGSNEATPHRKPAYPHTGTGLRWRIAHSAPPAAEGWGNLDVTDGTSPQRFPPPWVIDRIPGGYVVRNAATEAEGPG